MTYHNYRFLEFLAVERQLSSQNLGRLLWNVHHPQHHGYTLHNVCVFTSLDSLFGWCHLQNTYSMYPPFQHCREVSRSNFPIMSWFLHPAYLLHQQIPQLMGVLCANSYIYMQVQFIVPCAKSLVSFPFICVSHSIVSYNVLSPCKLPKRMVSEADHILCDIRQEFRHPVTLLFGNLLHGCCKWLFIIFIVDLPWYIPWTIVIFQFANC